MILTGKSLEAKYMQYKSCDYKVSAVVPFTLGRQFMLFLTGIMALLLAACGGGSGGGGGGGGGAAVAQCPLTEDQFDTLTPDDLATLPAECDFLAVDPLVGLFILGTEIDGTDLKVYVHGVNQDFTPMTLADFEQASVTLDGVPANPVAAVAPAPAGVLSMALLADYSESITDADVIGMGELYSNIEKNAPADFEAEKVNFSSEEGTTSQDGATVITVKPGPLPHWTEDLPALLVANEFDPEQDRNNTTLFDAMGTALLGPIEPFSDNFDPTTDDFGLVERNGTQGGGGVVGTHPASLIMVQTGGLDTASQIMNLGDITGLLDRCHTTVIMMGTFQTTLDVDVLNALAGDRGAFVQALNTNFLRPAMQPYAESLGHLVVFTLSSDTNFEDTTVRIEVNGLGRDATETAYNGSFDTDGNCERIF